MISGKVAWRAVCGVPARLGSAIASICGREYTSAFMNGDISAGVAGFEAESVADSSDRPKDGVLAMEGFISEPV